MHRPLQLLLIPAALALLFPGTAAGAFPEDVDVQKLDSGSSPYNNSQWQTVFNYVSRELAMAISPKPLAPARTLGLYGFEMGVEANIAFIHADEGATDATGSQSYWQAMTESGTVSPAVVMPTVRLRKGLPYSFEVGTNFSYIAGTHQAVLGGYGRWSFNEGWRKVPDASITVAYNGMVGNEQLDLGTLEVDLAIGYSFPFGIDDKYASARFSPFGGWGHGAIHAQPKNVTESLSDRILPITGFDGSSLGDIDPATGNPKGLVDTHEFQYDKFFFGFSVQANHFGFLIDAEFIVPRGVHSVNTRLAVPF